MMKKILSLFVLLMVVTIGARAGDEWSIDFASIGENYDDKTGVTISASVAKVGGTDLGTCTVSSEALDQHFVLQTGTTWLMRKANGLYQGNGGGRAMGMLGCTKGQVITIVGTGDPNPSTNATLKSQNGNTYVYTVTADGDVKFTPARYLYFTSITVENPSASAVSYTVKYVDEGGTEIKDATTGEGDPGASITISSVEKASFFNEGATKKYIYKSDDSEGMTIASDGSTVVTLTFREAATYTYSVVDNLDNKLAEGSAFEGETVYYYVPYYAFKDNKFYATPSLSSGSLSYGQGKIENISSNAEVTVTYTEEENTNVVFYAEAENLAGITPYEDGFVQSRMSNGKVGYYGEQTAFTTLPAGKYTLTTSTRSGSTTFYAGAIGEGSKVAEVTSSGAVTDVTSDEFVLNSESGIYTSTGDNANYFDYVIIRKTGEYVPVVPTYTVTISNEIENGTVVADPTSANAGAEVTLTNTPAEGYEFVSYSVTCKTNNEAVTVTDGKFTMPADDVTVSATFQLPTPPSYDITVADGIENGTVEVNPTTAKAGEEVTVTATPAEGYELASISVTGQTSNLAVEVTDGKFTMPADAVTVNAKFQQKAVDPSGDEEIALAADMFYTWDGYGADASKIASATVDFKLGESVAAGGVVAGTGGVDYLTYADMTGSTKVIFEGVNGTPIRLLMNRQESNNGPLVEKNATITDGKAEISLTDLDFVHVNAIKINWGAPEGSTINSITFVKPNDPLAGPKEALKDAIAAAKMQNSVAKTEESFAALTKAITDGEAALADAQATAESLTTAKSDIETAVKGLTLAEGYAELTKEMFKQYASVDEPGEGTATNGAYELFTASDLPYGDGSVSELKWADLTKYDKLIVTVAGATAPRLCMNRLVKDGQQAATQEDSKMLDINPNNDNKWSTEKYQTVADGVYTIDLAAIVKDYGFARLHCIKKQGWGAGVVVTGMYLHEAPVTYDITVADNIENGTVTVDPTTAKAGDEVTITATPAEGYELASISVTGQTSNLAVEVTDGKFTMPADDVTVSAKFQKKVIYIDTDLTAKFNSLATTQWTGSSGQVGWAAPKVKTNTGLEVAAWERYNGSCDWTGDIMSSSVTGLAPGTYKIELYGAAAFTFDRGFGSTAFTGDFSKDKSDTYKENESIDENTGVTLYAETAEGKVSKEIPIWYATNFNTSGIATATLENVIVGESGEIKIGLSKTSTSTNWHVVQLKGVTAQVPAADVLADAVEAAKSIAESDVPAKLYSEIQTAIETYDKEYATADEYLTAINALNALVDKANGYAPLSAVLNEGAQYKANVPAEDPAIAAYDAATADVKSAYDDAVVADIPAAVKVVEAALPALAKAQTAPGSDLTTLVNNTSWTCPQGNGPGKYQEIYTETYNESAYQPGKVIYQKIEGLIPGGVYEVKFLAVANTAWGKSNFGDGLAQVYANEVTSDISVIEQNNCNPTEYEQTLTAEVGDDGVFEYGMQNVAAGGNWYVVKGVSMTLKEVIISYSVDIAEGIENGTVEVSAKKAAAGEEVTITATPAEGYELASITVTGVASEEIVEVTDGKFTMPADDVTVTATFVLATGIDAAPADKSIKADGKYFKNGKLIIIKNGKEYNAAGVAK